MSQIIKQPNTPGDVERYAIWSSMVGDFTHLSMTEDEIVRHFASEAYELAREKALKIIEQLCKGEKPYHQFTLTWGQANERAYNAHHDAYEVEAGHNKSKTKTTWRHDQED